MKVQPRILLLTPPLVQTNCPYPATMHLAAYLRGKGHVVAQRDLSVRVVRDVLVRFGGDEAEELLELLSGDAPDDAKLEASAWMDDLAIRIRREIDPSFGFSRYAAHLGESAADFGEVEKAVRKRGVIDRPLERRLAEAIEETDPGEIWVTCPFPGTLVPAFKIARYVRKHHPRIRLALGGGFVSTELRKMTDRRPYRYFDEFHFDSPPDMPVFVVPSYDGIDWSEYFDVVETANPMHRLWSTGRWVKLVMAPGCYWHRCAFCDVNLDYIKCFTMPAAAEIVDCMEGFVRRGLGRFHFVDEAMPPKLIREVCEEVLRRKLVCEWWGNVRFDASFTVAMAKLMSRAGCIAVTGGLECANDRLLKLMNKGITLASAEKALTAFRRAGIMVHAYLMYGFPTETANEARRALGFVRKLFKADLIQSAFWHRFALTVHSPIARDPARFGIRIEPVGDLRRFALNEIPYVEPAAPDWRRLGKGLDLALYNYLDGRGLSKPLSFWFKAQFGDDGVNPS